MSLKDRRLLVLSLISGEDFEEIPTACIGAEAKLGPQVLCTDPVKHYNNPQFKQELAWELDRRSLRLYRSYRHLIRLTFYTLHGDGCPRVKDPLGYLFLEPREATQKKLFSWHQLLDNNVKPHPVVCCGLYVESCLG
ncbi:Centrosomal protein [Echinococcus granulosus]|uniref:Centrosomal protein of 120 kDa n=1 Tax=Echinococcus granulosus TaxID=6210 RepID=A0A068WHS5_ECHGR|nr:Centrosomal protein [Echinococcus granulosus]CDS17160.1 centrosomal protein of 120 kDa [Echinococcus granulosus]